MVVSGELQAPVPLPNPGESRGVYSIQDYVTLVWTMWGIEKSEIAKYYVKELPTSKG
jgi:hypothetical protein